MLLATPLRAGGAVTEELPTPTGTWYKWNVTGYDGEVYSNTLPTTSKSAQPYSYPYLDDAYKITGYIEYNSYDKTARLDGTSYTVTGYTTVNY